MPQSVPSCSQILGEFVASFAPQDLSEVLRHEAKRSILNVIGCALAVPNDPAVNAALQVMQPFSGAPTATVFGRVERLDMMAASFINAMAGNLLDFDDTHLRTVIHPSAPVAPPVLALAEKHGSRGEQVLLAFVLGAEVECRLGSAVAGHYARGWHITATCGVFGAAAAAASVLGFNAQMTTNALGVASSQSAGLVENLPSAAKNVGVGNAARNGLLAALLAERGYSGAPAAIEGVRGWARAAGDELNLDEVSGELGQRWEFLRNTYKPYPCGIVMHSVIDACLALRDEHSLQPQQIQSVVVRGDDLLLARGDRVVNNERDAKVSIHHCAAAALLWGRAGIAEFAADKVMCSEALAMRAKVQAQREPDLPSGACEVIIRTTSEAEYRRTVIHAHGSIEAPLSDAQLEAKFRDNARLGGSGCDVDAALGALWELDGERDVSRLMRALTAR